MLRGLFADSTAGVLFVDQERRIVSANNAALALIEGQTPLRPFGVTCGESLACPLGIACPLDDEGHPDASKSCEAPVFGRTLPGLEGGQQVAISCHRLPFGPGSTMRGMVVIRKLAS
jgi:hypothetical protein